ncbi:MAG: bifunctional 3-deoxy-7-phosphoheptulonate synthase/chorismate mutase [Phycisphaerales bacterium]|nr:bifunctional 3-deoxy-7-phosphoheptulonate synthase/chorismate mutase [Phycisphaerales bacterium]
MTPELQKLREQLDQLDSRIVEDLARRLSVVDEIGSVKAGGDDAIRDITREEELLTRIVELGQKSGVDGFLLTRIFREILDYSVRRQHQELLDEHNPDQRSERVLKVAYQGAQGAYSQIAAERHFSPRGTEISYRGFRTFKEALDAVRDGETDYAVIPIENTTAGSINEAYDLLARMNLAVVGEEVLKVEHCILALEPVPISSIRRVYSHPQALVQCSDFLNSLQDCHVESFADTALSAQHVARAKDLSQAAIASEEAGRIYGLHVIRRDITNQKENYTRFVIVTNQPMKFDERIPCKTSVIFATRDEEGALLKCLKVFHDHHLNLTKLESRPRPNTPWEYLFYVDFRGNVGDPDVQAALRELTTYTSFLKTLGSYPSRTTRDAQPAEPKRPPRKRTERPAPADAAAIEPAVLKTLEKAPYKLVSRATRAQDTTITVRNVTIGGDRPVIIAGPCSVESRDQILACAKFAHEIGVDILRGGCFKPRTSPYSFQGLGYEGLDLLEEAGRLFNLPIITEVMHPADVERVAQKSDILQLGARNMQNFSLLKEIGQADRPVMLKRGLMASIDEWLAAAEYILAHGNQRVILCERGIRTFETATRNTLDLSAVPVVKERTHLPVIVDPSHACGEWRWVPSLTRAALACGAHGVMVEFHPDPSKALSDGPQALTFDVLSNLMEQIQADQAIASGEA